MERQGQKIKPQWIGLLLAVAISFLAGCAPEKSISTGEAIENVPDKGSDAAPGTESAERVSDGESEQKEPSVKERFLQCMAEELPGQTENQDAFYDWLVENCGEEAVEEAVNRAEAEKAVEEAVNRAEADEAEPEENETESDREDVWYNLTGRTLQVLLCEYRRETAPETLQNVYWKKCVSETETILDFTGDISLAETARTTKRLDSQGGAISQCLSQELLEELSGADILTINNEFAYSTRGSALAGKSYTFRANPSRVAVLDEIGVDLVGLANNHVYDYGEEALLDTFDTLEEDGMPYIGAGRNLAEAKQPVYFIANGRKIGIVAATQIERSTLYTKEATDTSPGVLRTLDPEKFAGVIEEADQNSDVVIAYVHWGTEGSSFYQADQVELANAYVEAGADVIIGGHTHCLQGAAFIEDVPVFYSLGNFWFNGKTMNTGIAQIIIEEDGTIEQRFLPCVQSDCQTWLVTDVDKKAGQLDEFRSLSDGVEIDEEGYIKKTE